MNFCGIVSANLKMGTGRNFSMSGINSGRWNRTMLNLCVLWRPFWKLRPLEIVRCQESIRDIIIYPHIKWRWNQTMLNFAVLWRRFWKWRPVEIVQCWELIQDIIRKRPFNLKGGLWFFLKKYSDSQCCWKKYSDFGGEKKIIWFRVSVIQPNVKFWKKNSRFAWQKINKSNSERNKKP